MKIAITTSGGDAPGLNAVIRAVTTAGRRRGHEVFGIRNGFEGLLRDGEMVELDEPAVVGIEREGGTILGAASSGNPFGTGTLDDLVEALRSHGVEAVVMVGGDGTMGIARMLHDAGIRVVGVPKTIDRDIVGTWTTFGFDTAVETATEALDKLHTTARSHGRLMVVEVMGRDTGWIALYAGIAGGAHMIAIPEIPYDADVFAEHIRRRERQGAQYHILVAAEGARARGGEPLRRERTGRYGGIAEVLAAELQDRTGKTARALSLGHLLRGGAPTVFDRVLGLRLGSAAISFLDRGESGIMIGFRPPGFTAVPLHEVAGRIKRVGPDAHELTTARNLGISFGDGA
ncbi:MAG TPA: ATP-dependent 6-phosphofructokinase [Longimicrobiales bacterium]